MMRLYFASVIAATLQGTAPDSSWDLLSPRGQDLFADGAASYNRLEESRRTTFHAIIHALEAVDLDHLVVSVDEIWGALPSSSEGRHQHRLSVTLTKGAVEELESRDDFTKHGCGGHVKRADGQLVGWPEWFGRFGLAGRLVGQAVVEGVIRRCSETDTVRQRRSDISPASIQISWLEDEPTVGDIDIDYVEKRNILGHLSPRNSDVTFQFPEGEPHYLLHLMTFGGLPQWWRRL